MTELPDGTSKDYFLKTCAEDVAPVMMEGEFHSLSTIRSLMPDFAPQVYGWGECKGTPGTYFLIMDFLDLIDEIPDPATLATLVSDMHKKGDSPTGMFGFDKPTCHGKIIQPNTWDSNWCRYFTRLLTVFYDADMEVHGSIPGFEEAFATLKEDVIPRLLGPLQTSGRVLKPSLVHGDLWHGNVGTSVETGEPVVYDASCSYAHHEYELGMWRRIIVSFDQTYMKQYLLRLPPSEPTEEWDDRNRLYCIKFNFSHSAHWLGASDITRKM
jgi:protein-ribulosamine 3-kinase